MKKYVLMLCCSLLFMGCSTNKTIDTAIETSSYVTDKMKQNSISSEMIATTIEYTPKVMYDYASDIALVTIISLDSCDMDFFEFVPSTYGKLIVQSTIKGNLADKKELQYVKPGGYISAKEFEKYDEEEAVEKREHLRGNMKNDDTYYHVLLDDDIQIEEGKTYLAYFTYHKDKNVYEIIGLGNGLRETNISKEIGLSKSTPIHMNDVQIKNNHDGQYQSLQNYINTAIIPYQK